MSKDFNFCVGVEFPSLQHFKDAIKEQTFAIKSLIAKMQVLSGLVKL